MEKDLDSSHVEDNNASSATHSAQVILDSDLLKAGADEIKEDNVANIHLVNFYGKIYSVKNYLMIHIGSSIGSEQASDLGSRSSQALWHVFSRIPLFNYERVRWIVDGKYQRHR